MRTFVPVCVFTLGCAATAPSPATVRLGEDTCAHCRMALVSTRTAAQIVAPGEEPMIFDDLGCLRDYLPAHPLPAGARIFVADHRTGSWIDASSAVFTRTSLATPMSSGLVAHADVASREADSDARGGTAVTTDSVLHAQR